MYSFKEKQKHFSELQNPDAASLDLQLLTQKTSSHPLLRKFSRNPQRYANEILYQLLDVAERDEIRNNRRPPVPQKVQPQSNKTDNSNPQKEENGKFSIVESEKVEDGNITQESSAPTTTVLENQDKISDVTNQIVEAEGRAEEAEQRADEAKERVEESELRAEEAEQHAEEAEERADNAETALEQEKKKVVTTSKPVSNPKVKSKSGKSTRKLTGTTSPTRKSRQPRSSTTTGS